MTISKLITETIKILKTVKWDYAKMAQLAKLWGGPQKAALALVSLGAIVGSGTSLIAQKLKKMSSLKKKVNTKSSEKDYIIQIKTKDYLNAVEERKKLNQATDDLDEEYSNFMLSLENS